MRCRSRRGFEDLSRLVASAQRLAERPADRDVFGPERRHAIQVTAGDRGVLRRPRGADGVSVAWSEGCE
jgi:hypothetical protein